MKDKNLQLFEDITGTRYDESNYIHREGMRRLESLEREMQEGRKFLWFQIKWFVIGSSLWIISLILISIKIIY